MFDASETLKKEWRTLIVAHHTAHGESLEAKWELELALGDLDGYFFKGVVPPTVWECLPENIQKDICWEQKSHRTQGFLLALTCACILTSLYHLAGGRVALYSSFFVFALGVVAYNKLTAKDDLFSKMRAPGTAHLFSSEQRRLQFVVRKGRPQGALTEAVETTGQEGQLTEVQEAVVEGRLTLVSEGASLCKGK